MKSITIFIVLVTLTMLVAGCNKEIAVVTAYNLSDQNWTLGVAKNWAGFFVKNTDDNKKNLSIGKKVRFANGSIRNIVKQESSGEYLNIFLDGQPLDGMLVGYPKEIKIFE